MNSSINKSKGFTLIELIIVIIILGILAVTAAPKFIDIQTDAQKAALKGAKGGIAAAMMIIYGKSALDGNQKDDATGVPATEPKVGNVLTVFGYPVATISATGGILEAAGIDPKDFTVAVVENSDPAGISIRPNGGASDTCQITYTQADNADTAAVVSGVYTGC